MSGSGVFVLVKDVLDLGLDLIHCRHDGCVIAVLVVFVWLVGSQEELRSVEVVVW